jgi:Tfp pilus assembly protein PilV
MRVAGSRAGLKVAEYLAAVFVISLGLVAVGAGFATAIQGVEASRQQNTAAFLAEQRLEQIRATALGSSLAACMGFANITGACFAAQAYGSIPRRRAQAGRRRGLLSAGRRLARAAVSRAQRPAVHADREPHMSAADN